MHLPRIDITNDFAELGFRIRKSNMEIRQPNAEVKIRQPQPDFVMTKTKGKLEINQDEAFADADLKHPFIRIKEWADRAKQKVLQDIAQEASEGERLMSVETQNKNTIAQIAREQTTPSQKPVNLTFIPKTPLEVKFHYTPSEIDMNIEKHDPLIKITPKKPIIRYDLGDVQNYLRQKSSIQYRIVGELYDRNI